MKKIEYYGLIGTIGDGKASVYWFRDKEIVDTLISQSMFAMTEKVIVMACLDYRDIEAELGIEFADSAWKVFMDIPPDEDEPIKPKEKELEAFAQSIADSIFWGPDCSG